MNGMLVFFGSRWVTPEIKLAVSSGNVDRSNDAQKVDRGPGVLVYDFMAYLYFFCTAL